MLKQWTNPAYMCLMLSWCCVYVVVMVMCVYVCDVLHYVVRVMLSRRCLCGVVIGDICVGEREGEGRERERFLCWPC